MCPHPEQTVPRIFAAIDDRRFDDLRGLYTENVRGRTVLGEISGVSDVVATLRRVHEPIAAFQHLVSGLVVALDGSAATVRANVVAVFCDVQRNPVFEGASIWRGVLHRDAGGWRVAEFTMELVWSRATVAPAAGAGSAGQ